MKITLNRSQAFAMETLLDVALASVTMEELREQPHQYVIAASLFEVRQKVKVKAEELRMFHKNKFTLRLTRTQALAFDVWFNPHDFDSEVVATGSDTVKTGSFELGLIVQICGMVNQEFYI